MKREKYIIVQSIVSAIRIVSTMFESLDDEQEYGREDMEEIKNEVLQRVSKFKVENLWAVCDIILKDKR